MMHFKPVALAATLAFASLSVWAQAAPAPATPRADAREAKQDARIQNGVASGQLNAKETYRLEKQQARINAAEADAKADGKVTRAERARIERKQDRASANIARQKHDAQTAKP
jgi:uncharacterized membrane protein YebE (DUF533 family)